MKCQKCGKEIDVLEANFFDREGADYWSRVELFEPWTDASYVELEKNWTGYDFDWDDPEVKDTIRCPECHQFPFDSDEIQEFEFIRVVMYKK